MLKKCKFKSKVKSPLHKRSCCRRLSDHLVATTDIGNGIITWMMKPKARFHQKHRNSELCVTGASVAFVCQPPSS